MNKKVAPKLSKEARISQPFLNKYYWNPDMELVPSCAYTELYNESILVLDDDGVYKQMPYIMGMNSGQLDVLTEYFGTHPIHQTNRISMIKKSHANKSEVSRFESLISEQIKPKIIITFSESVGKELKNLFKIHFEKQLEHMGFWSGIARIKNKYFYIYCLPITSELDIRSIEVNKYLMSSRVFDFQTCLHMNDILKNDTTFSIPKRLIADQSMRENILRLQDLNFIAMPSLHRKSISDVANAIRDFDEYDLIIAQYLNDYCPGSAAINLSTSDYLELRNNESSKSLCHKYFNRIDLNYKLYVLDLALMRLYLYSHYPQESFDFDWKERMQCNEFVSNDYKDRLKAFDAFKETLCHASDIALIGIGEHGMSILHQLQLDKVPVARFIAVNRDRLILNAFRADKEIKLNAPKDDPEVIIKEVTKHAFKIREALSGMDAVVLVVGLGGMTGTHAAPEIARIAQGLELPVWAVVTMPFAFEGERRAIEAQKGFDQLKPFTVEIRKVKSQDIICAQDPNMSMLKAFRLVDIVTSRAVRVILYRPV